MKTITVKEEGRERIIFIPDTGDEGYNKDLEQMAEEKTRAELKAMPPRKKPTASKKDVAEALKERLDFNKRKREDGIKKYY